MSQQITLYDAILTGNAEQALSLTQAALDAGADPEELVRKRMIPAMNEVGSRFERGEYFVPELLIAARAMKTALSKLRPLLAESGVEPVARVVIGTVKGDLHDIGKGLVGSMMEGGGFEVVDLGVDISADQFVAEAKRRNADLIAVSALLTTTMTGMQHVVDAVRDAGFEKPCKVMIGGAPVTQQFAESIGADGFGENASAAVAMAKRLTAETH